MNDNPKLKIKLDIYDTCIEIGIVVLLVSFWIYILLNYTKLPSIIPIHFDGNGTPNGFGSKKHTLLLPIISTIFYIGFTILNKFPHIFNYLKPVTTSNALGQYTLATKFIRTLKFTIILVFLFISCKANEVALGKSNGIGKYSLPIILGLIYIPLFVFIVVWFSKSRKNN